MYRYTRTKSHYAAFLFPQWTHLCIVFNNAGGFQFRHPPPTQIYAVAHYLLNKKIRPKHGDCRSEPKSTASGCRIMGMCVSPGEVPQRTPIYKETFRDDPVYSLSIEGGLFLVTRLWLLLSFLTSTAYWMNQPYNLPPQHNFFFQLSFSSSCWLVCIKKSIWLFLSDFSCSRKFVFQSLASAQGPFCLTTHSMFKAVTAEMVLYVLKGHY